MPIVPCLESLPARHDYTRNRRALGSAPAVRKQGYNRIIEVDWEYKNDTTDTWIRLSDAPWHKPQPGNLHEWGPPHTAALAEVSGWFLSGHSGLAASPLNVL